MIRTNVKPEDLQTRQQISCAVKRCSEEQEELVVDFHIGRRLTRYGEVFHLRYPRLVTDEATSPEDFAETSSSSRESSRNFS